jgi:clan AA aspartic protease (TIGR02281 family)
MQWALNFSPSAPPNFLAFYPVFLMRLTSLIRRNTIVYKGEKLLLQDMCFNIFNNFGFKAMHNRVGYLRLLIPLIVMGNLTLGHSSLAYGTDDELAPMPGGTLWDELKKVAAKYGIIIKGMGKTRDSPARPAQGALQEQLRKLLFDFNYVLVQSSDGGIKKVFILNQKEAAPEIPEQIILNTTRSGNHHVVQVIIEGPSRTSMEVSLLVDTGASLMVLPASMLPKLGFSSGELESQEIRTANGPIYAKIGQLHSLEIGQEIMHDINAAFIEDSLLGPNGLLGMNVLGHYLVTIDDQQNLITLSKQR